MLLVSIVFLQQILGAFFPPLAPAIEPDVVSSILDDTKSKEPSSDVSSMRKQITSRHASKKTQPPPEQPLYEQAQKEAPTHEESLQSMITEQWSANLMELEEIQIGDQEWVNEQAQWEAAEAPAYDESVLSRGR